VDAPTPTDAPSDVSPTGNALAISIEASALCAGRDGKVSFDVTGGDAPYTWSLGVGSTWRLDEVTGARVSLSGTAPSSGPSTVTVQVVDAHGETETRGFALDVFEPPQVDPSLPHACPGQAYSTTLRAFVDDAAPLEWSVSGEDGGAVALSGSVLSTTPTEPGILSFTATVTDEHCASDPKELSIVVDPVGVGECPTIMPDTLPNPCVDSPYTPQAIEARGGQGSLTFRALSIPDGLAFDPTTLTVSGEGKAAGDLILSVSDEAGHVVQKSYPIAPRDTCWLAYQSTAPGNGGGLHFFDPVLAVDRAFPNSATMTDAKFSPDGRYLAYRTTASGPSDLVLIAAPKWTQQPLSFGSSVDRYVWSPDSRTLAVAYHDGTTSYLGGAVISGSGGAPDAGGAVSGSADGGSGTSASLLAATPASVESEIVWLGNSRVGFLVLVDPDDAVPYTAQIAGNAVSTTQIDHVVYDPNSTLQGTPSGFLIIDSDFSDIGFYGGFDATPYALSLPNVFTDPEGHYVADVKGTGLEAYRALPDGFGSPFATSATGCATLLAWAPGSERIACTNDNPQGDDAAIFTLDGKTTSLVGAPIYDTADYTIGASTTHRRAFSASGNWFAFVLPNALGVARLGDGTPYVVGRVNPLSVTPADHTDELAFSPDEHLLLWQSDTNLAAISLNDASLHAGGPQIGQMISPVQCSDRFIDDPSDWCGRSSASPTLPWSPDSRFTAARLTDGSLRTYDVESVANVGTNTACAAQCGFFTFQP
jgi:hypothetical protein